MNEQQLAQRIIMRLDPERAWLMFIYEMSCMFADLHNRPDDYRQAIERYAPTMPQDNAAHIREHFPALLAWSERGFGTSHTDLPKDRTRRAFGKGNMLDPLVWCYYDHDPARMEWLNTLCAGALEYRQTHPDEPGVITLDRIKSRSRRN